MDRSSACVAAPTSRTFHYRDDRTFEQDVGADCSNSCVARYLSTRRRAGVPAGLNFLDAQNESEQQLFIKKPLNYYLENMY